MTETQIKAINLIEGQIKLFGAHSTVRMAGEQLKEIARANAHDAELLAEDLQQKGMKVGDAERKIRARADEIHIKEKGNAIAVPPWEAEDILRKFYGLSERTWGPGKEQPEETQEPKPATKEDKGKIIDLADFF